MSALVDKSILIRTEHDGAVRFRLLETVREYGLARLTDTDDHTSLRRRHATWYQQLATNAEAQWFGPQQLHLVRRLSVEMPNIREALQFSLTDSPATAVDMTAALRPFWVFHTMLGEGGQWTRRALAATPPEAQMQRVRALFTAAHVAHIHGDLATAVGWFAELHELLEVIEDPVIRGLLTYLEGYTALLTGDIGRGTRLLPAGTGRDRRLRSPGGVLAVDGNSWSWLQATPTVRWHGLKKDSPWPKPGATG